MSFQNLNTIPAPGNNPAPTMSSLEIAKLVESQHSKVRQSIERLAERGVITLRPLGEVSNEGPGPKTIKVYNLEKRDSFVVVAQLSPEFTARLVDRWQELEQAQKTAPLAADTPASLALRDVQAGLGLAELLGCPRSYAIQVTSQHAERLTGYPVTMLANQAADCQDVPEEDIMLEPTDLGKLFGLSGMKMNKKLAEHGLQEKVGNKWVPTAKGKTLSARHAWVKKSKSDYNFKWNYKAVKDLIAEQEEEALPHWMT